MSDKTALSLKHFQDVQTGLNSYIEQRIGEYNDDNAESHRLINRFREAFEYLSGLGKILNSCCGEENPSADQMNQTRMNIYRSLGAPGDWGYGTDIGQTLSKLYSAESI